MADIDYTRNYFSKYAAHWLAGAYGEGEFPWKYPVGFHRVRLTVEAVVNVLGTTEGRFLVDLGCGGGELCEHIANLGMTVQGIDIAEGMIEQANARRDALPPETRARLDFQVGDVLGVDLPKEQYDAVTALGLIEYFPNDSGLFEKAFSLLKPGGVFVVSVRNRLFNLFSLNEYTEAELESGNTWDLLDEIRNLDYRAADPEMMRGFIQVLKKAIPQIERALERDIELAEQKLDANAKRVRKFDQQRRQHTPKELIKSSESAGFANSTLVGVHPHLFPPQLEFVIPYSYNQIASALEVFEEHEVSLRWSSAFLGVFVKPTD